jgi:hypothetical protein
VTICNVHLACRNWLLYERWLHVLEACSLHELHAIKEWGVADAEAGARAIQSATHRRRSLRTARWAM